MKMQSRNLRNSLAAEYVIGTLIGGARKRFEYYCHQDPSLQALVQKWGQLLNPLGCMLKPVKPPRRVWKKIERRLNSKTVKYSLWNNVFLWRSLSTLGAALTVILSVYISNYQLTAPQDAASHYLAVIQNKQSQGAWVLSTDTSKKYLIVRNIKPQQLASNKDFELWLLPDSSKKKSFKAPISIGLIKAGTETKIALSEKLLAVIKLAGGVAVSLEPSGGSPTGQPTGPVLYQGKLQIL